MIEMSLAQLAAVVGGAVVGGADADRVSVSGAAAIDSRAVEPGGLFVALAGEHVDGHDYAAAAVAAGAAAVLGSRDCAVPGVLVDDPVAALGLLARHVLDGLPELPVVALTGSAGKTGTKDYLAQVLAGAGATVATQGNYNNELGVPLTVLRVTQATEYLVVEMGARGVGHIAELCRIAPPRVAAVLNIGTAHVGEFGSREYIAQAKGEIVEALPADGTAVLNADDPLTAAMVGRTRARVLRFGAADAAGAAEVGVEVAWREVRLDDLGRATFQLGFGGDWARVTLSQLGEHQVANAAAAAAMALAVGLPLDLVARGLCASRAASHWRMEPHQRADGLLVVNDAYNANPESMQAALETLARIGGNRAGRTVAVLGEMLELGADEERAHRAVGAVAAGAPVDVLVTVGERAAWAADGAEEVPGFAGRVVRAHSGDQALSWLRDNVTAADVVLVKASRGAALEHIADGLLAQVPTPAETEGDGAR